MLDRYQYKLNSFQDKGLELLEEAHRQVGLEPGLAKSRIGMRGKPRLQQLLLFCVAIDLSSKCFLVRGGHLLAVAMPAAMC